MIGVPVKKKVEFKELATFIGKDGKKYRIISSEGLLEYRSKDGRKFYRLLIEPVEEK